MRTRWTLFVLAVTVLGAAAPAYADVTASVTSGQLRVASDGEGDRVRLRAGAQNTVRVIDDVDRRELAFDRTTFTRILLEAGAGADVVTVDSTAGVFTDTEDPSFAAGWETTSSRAATGPRTASATRARIVLLAETATTWSPARVKRTP